MVQVESLILNLDEIAFAYWDFKELIIGVGQHRIRASGDEAQEVWKVLGGKDDTFEEHQYKHGIWKSE